MSRRAIILAGMGVILVTGPSLRADRIRVGASAWSASTQSEYFSRNAIQINQYDTLYLAAPFRASATAMGQTATGDVPAEHRFGSSRSRDRAAGPGSIEYWLMIGKSSLIFGCSAYSMNPSYRYGLLEQTVYVLNGTPLLTTNMAGSGKDEQTLRGTEAYLGLRLALGDRVALIPQVSGLTLHRSIDSRAVSQWSQDVPSFGVINDSLVIENRSLSGRARGLLVGLGFEISFTDNFALIGELAASPREITGPYSETNVQIMQPQTGDPTTVITLNNERMKVSVRRGTLGFQYTVAEKIHLRLGFREEDHIISYDSLPFQVGVAGSSVLTTEDFLSAYPWDYKMLLYQEMKSRRVPKADRTGGAFFGLIYDIDFG